MQGLNYLSFIIILFALVLISGTVAGDVNATLPAAGGEEIQAFNSVNNASLSLHAGQNALQAGKYEEALEQYTITTELEPSWVAAWYLKAYSLEKLNRSGEALAAVNQALVLDPSDRDSNNLKADVLEHLGRADEAVKYQRTPAIPSAGPSSPVTATTARPAPMHPVSLISGLTGIIILAGVYDKKTRDKGSGNTTSR